jgi:hypothetical protein
MLVLFRTAIKNGCLAALVAEPEKSVAQSIARLIAAIAKHEVKRIFPFVWSRLKILAKLLHSIKQSR